MYIYSQLIMILNMDLLGWKYKGLRVEGLESESELELELALGIEKRERATGEEEVKKKRGGKGKGRKRKRVYMPINLNLNNFPSRSLTKEWVTVWRARLS